MGFASTLFQPKQANPAATAVNSAGNGHGSLPEDDLAPHTGASGGQGERIVQFMRSLGWKRPARAGASITDFQSPNGQDEIWVHWDGWRHVRRNQGQWQEIAEGAGLEELQQHLAQSKLARKPMHDDSGASTGLRMQPDYGESDSYTTQMNEANSKGAASGHIVVLDTPGKLAYVTGVEYDPKDGVKLAKFAFAEDRELALVLPKLSAESLSRQIGSPAFGAVSHVVLATDYTEMFSGLLQAAPRYEKEIDREIAWAKKGLKKQDRIVWYLRWYRLALAQFLLDRGNADAKPKSRPAPPARPQQAPSLMGEEQGQQGEEPQGQTPVQVYQALAGKYGKELSAKGGNPAEAKPLKEFTAFKQNLEHFLSLPVHDIQNYIFKAESFDGITQAFQAMERAWQEAAKRFLRPMEGDKVWMQFQDGWAWWWLPRSACELEAKAMGHCGNRPKSGRGDQTILSLREPRQVGKETMWEPHLTFVLHGGGEDGTLGEMKGRNNDKPVAKYHPYIIALLKDPRIHGFVGATWLAQNKREEVYEANPNLGTPLRKWYHMRGMDSRLQAQIVALLELGDEAKYSEADGGFVIKRWKDTEELVNDIGTRSAKRAYAYTQGDDNEVQLNPDNDDLISFALDTRNGEFVANVGLSLQNEFPKEAKEWFDPEISEFDGYDPGDEDDVKAFFEMLVEPTYTGEKAQYPEGRHDSRPGPPIGGLPKEKWKYRNIETLKIIRRAYMGGAPSADLVWDDLNEGLERLFEITRDDSTTLLKTRDGIARVLGAEDALEKAEQVQQGGSAPELDTLELDVRDNWDDWNDEYAAEALAEALGKPYKPKVPGSQRQKRLFTEPKTDAEAKRRGITVSKLKNPLFLRPNPSILA